jgi:hypothetical protein
VKEPKCSFCKEVGHYRINCFKAPRSPIKSNIKELKRTPLKRSATKTAIYASKPVKSLTKPVSRRKQLIKELDGHFSRYIRMSAAIDGVARCVTCGNRDSWKLMDNGHFLVRGKIGTRFDERNCHVQCRNCNRRLQGNMKQYELFMRARYGQKVIDELKSICRNNIPTYELEGMIKHYKAKLLTLSE